MAYSENGFAARGSRGAWALAAGLGSLLPIPAAAHMGTGLPGGFESGFIHPFSGFDHLLAMVSVGLWGAFLGRPLIYALPVIFPAMMVAGAIMGMFVMPLPPVEIGIALSVLVLGGCIALSVRAPVWAACVIVAIFAVFHGYAHGKELPSAADPVAYSVGFVLATGLLHVSGICLGLLNDLHRGIVVTRSMGGIIAVLGVWFLYRAIST
jgi:urease accessory protein